MTIYYIEAFKTGYKYQCLVMKNVKVIMEIVLGKATMPVFLFFNIYELPFSIFTLSASYMAFVCPLHPYC